VGEVFGLVGVVVVVVVGVLAIVDGEPDVLSPDKASSALDGTPPEDPPCDACAAS